MFKNEYCVHLFITPSRASFMQAMNSLGLCSCKSLRSKITQFSFIPTEPEKQHFSLCTRLFSSFPLWWGFACVGALDSCSSLKLIKTPWKRPLSAEHNATPRILRPFPHRLHHTGDTYPLSWFSPSSDWKATGIPWCLGNLTTGFPRCLGDLTTRIPWYLGNVTTGIPWCLGALTTGIPWCLDLTSGIPWCLGDMTTRISWCLGDLTTCLLWYLDLTAVIPWWLGALTTGIPWMPGLDYWDFLMPSNGSGMLMVLNKYRVREQSQL